MLVDWVCECADFFKLALTTAHAAVAIMDKALSRIEVSRYHFQLVAVASFVIASKYEEKEENLPNLAKIVAYIEDRQGGRVAQQFEARRVNNMEMLILTNLGFNVQQYTALSFVNVYVRLVSTAPLPPPPPH